MKLSEKERKAVAMLRQLHAQQREDVLADMERRVIANRIANRVSMRIGQLTKLDIPANRKVAKHYGLPKKVGTPGRKRRGGGETA